MVSVGQVVPVFMVCCHFPHGLEDEVHRLPFIQQVKGFDPVLMFFRIHHMDRLYAALIFKGIFMP
jgi:hypothetical protein